MTFCAGVIAMGGLHGINPAMGWPLAVAHGLEARRGLAVAATWIPLGAGHLLAMAVVLVPFALVGQLLHWGGPLRLASGVIMLGFGLSRLAWRRHPRWLARVRPSQLALWSFLMATAHGAALMVMPFLLGLCATPPAGAGPGAISLLMGPGLPTAVLVTLLHTTAMIASGWSLSWTVYRWLGLGALRSAWLDIERTWAWGLMVSGAAAIASAFL